MLFSSVFSFCPVQWQCIPLCLKHSFFSPFPKYLVYSDWLAHTCLSYHQSLCLQSALSCFQLLVSFTSTVKIVINYANVTQWHQDVTELRRHVLTRHFRSSDFCGREELSRPFTCTRTYMRKTLKESEKKKSEKEVSFKKVIMVNN